MFLAFIRIFLEISGNNLHSVDFLGFFFSCWVRLLHWFSMDKGKKTKSLRKKRTRSSKNRRKRTSASSGLSSSAIDKGNGAAIINTATIPEGENSLPFVLCLLHIVGVCVHESVPECHLSPKPIPPLPKNKITASCASLVANLSLGFVLNKRNRQCSSGRTTWSTTYEECHAPN